MSSTRLYLPFEQVFTNLGAIGAGWKIYTYLTGTNTPKVTYSDTALTVPNANPIIADSAGRFGNIYGNSAALYKFILKDADDNTIQTVDPVNPQTFSLADFDPQPASFWGVTSGTSSAYTLSSNPNISFIGYLNTQVFLVEFHISCAANPTLNIDNLGALNLKKKTGQGTKVSLLADDVNGRHWCTNDGTDIIVLNPRTQMLYLGTPPTVTIAAGVGTLPNSASNYLFETESAAATDDLDTINGGVDGQKITIGNVNNARNVVLKHNTGNIFNPTLSDITVDVTSDKIELIYSGALLKWIVLNNSYQNAFLSSKSSNGYTYLPNGLIIQFGEDTFTIGHAATRVITLPIAFPNSNLQVIGYVTNTVSTITTLVTCPLTDKTNSNFTFQYGTISGGSYTTTLRYIAIGY